MNTTPHRAKPLPPTERRQSIVEAILPLLLAKGSAVTSREMADAAGVAEGTIFRAFPDKAAVIREAVEASMDPAPICHALAGISEFAPIETQLETAAAVLLERIERVAALHNTLRTAHASSSGKPAGVPQFVRDSNAAILAGLTRLLQRHADRLRVQPDRAAIVFRGLVFANAHPMTAPDQKITPAELVDLLLSGIVVASEKSSS